MFVPEISANICYLVQKSSVLPVSWRFTKHANGDRGIRFPYFLYVSLTPVLLLFCVWLGIQTALLRFYYQILYLFQFCTMRSPSYLTLFSYPPRYDQFKIFFLRTDNQYSLYYAVFCNLLLFFPLISLFWNILTLCSHFNTKNPVFLLLFRAVKIAVVFVLITTFLNSRRDDIWLWNGCKQTFTRFRFYDIFPKYFNCATFTRDLSNIFLCFVILPWILCNFRLQFHQTGNSKQFASKSKK